MLITNRVQPFIRYGLGDRVMVKPDPCPCGSPFPAVRVMGRSTSLLGFAAANGTRVQVIPLALDTVIERVPGLHRFQAIHTGPSSMRLRIEPKPWADTEVVFLDARARITSYLEDQGAAGVRVELDPDAPHPDRLSGKFHEVWSEAGTRPKA